MNHHLHFFSGQGFLSAKIFVFPETILASAASAIEGAYPSWNRYPWMGSAGKIAFLLYQDFIVFCVDSYWILSLLLYEENW